MPPTILPVITFDDYDTFRGILRSDIADTYDKWLDLFAQLEKLYSRNGGSPGIITKIGSSPATVIVPQPRCEPINVDLIRTLRPL